MVKKTKTNKVEKRLTELEDRADRTDRAENTIASWMASYFIAFIVIALIFMFMFVTSMVNVEEENKVDRDVILNLYCQSYNHTGFIKDSERDYDVRPSRFRLGYCYDSTHKPYTKVWLDDFEIFEKINEAMRVTQE